MHTQRFRLENETLDLEVVQGPDGKFFCPWQNIQDTFPGATVFEVKKIRVFPMTDENGNRYEPKRIRHYPDDIIEVITSQDHTSLNHHDNSFTMVQHPTNTSSSTPYFDQTTSTLAPFKDPPVSTLNISLSQLSTTDNALTNSSPQPHVTLYHSTTPLSMLTANIAELRHELAQHSDSQSTRHIQLTEQLFHLFQQQSELLQKQAEMLQEQAEAKRRDEEHKRMLQQSVDRMVILQRGIDAVLVQNYELHEYPIPRLFVILPEKIASKVIKDIEHSKDDSESLSGSEEKDEDQEGFIDTIKSLDPRNLLEDKFRLYFLCECGDHSSTETDTATSYDQTSARPTVNIKNKVHLAKHEGYQLSRPTQFLKQYGPYILGMLQILKFCLDAAKFIAPAVGIAQDSLQKAADSVKSASEHTLEAVNISINFLETKLGGDINLNSQGGNDIGDDIFKNLAALEGADLRQLETFLRNKDKDKILGNLYRTTTPEGHVKWVCLEHFKTSYRENAMGVLLNTIEVNNGTYDKQLKKITLVLPSSTVTKDLMKQLVTYSFAVDELDLTLDFGFGSPDLTRIVESLAQSNVKTLKLDLKDTEGLGRLDIKLPGKGKYHPLLGLMSNRKLQQLSLTGMDYFGTRTSDLSKYHAQSTLRSFHHLNYIRPSDTPRLVNILSFCTNLVDLRLGSYYFSRYHPDLRRAIGNLKRLEVLHLTGLANMSDDIANNEGYMDGVLLEVETAGIKLRELVVIGTAIYYEDINRAVHAFESTLETLVVSDIRVNVDLLSPRFKYEHGFPKLARLETRLNENQITDSRILAPFRTEGHSRISQTLRPYAP
ncbi:hypothetical protein BGX21_004039 [Mortierella sp. AD011]|nr:hypothetical protein BGX20_006015 [Mortierella sp. AD010]KAF9400562.1 hypothetical protein BGX21_004039 [Mortierella sp. AD011]